VNARLAGRDRLHVAVYKNNGITEGFHRKMKLIQRRAGRPSAYGFRNFNNYRLRVIAQCG
jgi:transposase